MLRLCFQHAALPAGGRIRCHRGADSCGRLRDPSGRCGCDVGLFDPCCSECAPSFRIRGKNIAKEENRTGRSSRRGSRMTDYYYLIPIAICLGLTAHGSLGVHVVAWERAVRRSRRRSRAYPSSGDERTAELISFVNLSISTWTQRGRTSLSHQIHLSRKKWMKSEVGPRIEISRGE